MNAQMPLHKHVRERLAEIVTVVFSPSCNATQPATINLLSRNVESQRIPIKKKSSVCVCVCSPCVCMFLKVLQLSVSGPTHPDMQTKLITAAIQYPMRSIRGPAVAAASQ